MFDEAAVDTVELCYILSTPSGSRRSETTIMGLFFLFVRAGRV